MGVKLRKRKLANDLEQYYFDVYHKGRREYPTLKDAQLIIRPGKDKATLKANAEVEKEAQRWVTILEGKLAAGTYKFQPKASVAPVEELGHHSFLEYFRIEAQKRRNRRGTKSNTYCCFKYFEQFVRVEYGEDLPFDLFTEQVAEKFRAFLEKFIAINKARKEGKHQESTSRGINSNCAILYFKRFKMLSAMAFKAGLIPRDVASQTKNFGFVMPQRHFLTPEEMKLLIQDWEVNPVDDLMKRAFLFACMTGLRWADLTALAWKDIQKETLDIAIQKSQGSKRLRFELDELALKMVGQRGMPKERIFPLKYNMFLNVKLDRWVLSNGINKKITWHCARHTFATLLLFKHDDISLVQAALAHSRLETTQIYAKVMNTKLSKATSSISDLFS